MHRPSDDRAEVAVDPPQRLDHGGNGLLLGRIGREPGHKLRPRAAVWDQPRDEPAEQPAQGVHIRRGRKTERLVAELLWGHEPQAAERRGGFPRDRPVAAEPDRDPEIGDLGRSVACEQHVPRLEVAVDKPRAVNRRHAAAHVGDEAHRLPRPDPAASLRPEVLKGAAFEVLVDNEHMPVVALAEVVHPHHRRVVETARLLGLRCEVCPGAVARVAAEHLRGHHRRAPRAGESHVLREVDIRKRPTADSAQQPVASAPIGEPWPQFTRSGRRRLAARILGAANRFVQGGRELSRPTDRPLQVRPLLDEHPGRLRHVNVSRQRRLEANIDHGVEHHVVADQTRQGRAVLRQRHRHAGRDPGRELPPRRHCVAAD